MCSGDVEVSVFWCGGSECVCSGVGEVSLSWACSGMGGYICVLFYCLLIGQARFWKQTTSVEFRYQKWHTLVLVITVHFTYDISTGRVDHRKKKGTKI